MFAENVPGATDTVAESGVFMVRFLIKILKATNNFTTNSRDPKPLFTALCESVNDRVHTSESGLNVLSKKKRLSCDGLFLESI